ncbi:MAG: AraC family transcriptional regulator [Cyanobacteria bacterium P01_F01_bin.150]
MNIVLSFNDLQQAAQEFQRKYGGKVQLASRETVLLLPDKFGRGLIRGINLRQGLDLIIYEYDLEHNLTLDFQKLALDCSFMKLTFCISGNCSGSMPDFNDSLDISALQTAFASVPCATGSIELLTGQTIKVIELLLDPTFVMTVVEHRLNQMPRDWQHILKAAASTPSCYLRYTSQAIAHVLQSILYCPHHGSLRKLYLEGKALELIALYFDELTDVMDCQSATPLRRNTDRLYEAKSILLQQMDDPPSLATLSQNVGLSERKLQQGFQNLFGKTVFGVLHDCRMEQARQLIEADQMSIGAIANSIGISHRGYFSTAFKRKFGTTPRNYSKQFK